MLGSARDAAGDERVITVGVEDESGKVDLNSASPWMLGNLFGATVTVEKASSSDGILEVEDTTAFPAGGMLFVQGEVQGELILRDSPWDPLVSLLPKREMVESYLWWPIFLDREMTLAGELDPEGFLPFADTISGSRWPGENGGPKKAA